MIGLEISTNIKISLIRQNNMISKSSFYIYKPWQTRLTIYIIN